MVMEGSYLMFYLRGIIGPYQDITFAVHRERYLSLYASFQDHAFVSVIYFKSGVKTIKCI